MVEAFALLTPVVKNLLDDAGIASPTPPQAEAIPLIFNGDNVLVIAPTGSGKTEAALLPLIDRMIQDHDRQGISLIYVTPLRALNRDLLKRLQSWSAKLGFKVEIRHGDTPQADRRRMVGHPPDLLITTPETLQAILPGRRMREHLRHVKAVVIDEIHELAGDRRGVQLIVGLERLREVTRHSFQRVGLSATVGNPEEIALFLGGSDPVRIVQIPLSKDTKYWVEFPRPTDADHELARRIYMAPEAAARLSLVSGLVEDHESTLIFVNSRTTAELLGSRFNMLDHNIMVHHGSLPKEERIRAEEAFKNGEVRGMVTTSTLELGIDIGSVDLTVQYMSPRQVTSLVQRVGRSGHSLSRTSKGVLVSVSTEDILESVAVIELARKGKLEPTKIHVGALDVLAHQIAGFLMDSEGTVQVPGLKTILGRAYPYMKLDDKQLEQVVDYLRKMGHLRRDGETLYRTSRTRSYYYENLSMIPDERRYIVVDLTNQQAVGILGEEFMIEKAHVGLNFIVKGRTWQMKQIAGDGRVYVLPVTDPTAAVPGWDGKLLPVPTELGQRVGSYRRGIDEALSKADGTIEPVFEKLSHEWPCDPYGVRKVVEEVQAHRKTGCPVPTDNRIVIEGFDRYIIVHSDFGDTVNFTLGEVVEELMRRQGIVRMWWNDPYRILYEMVADTADLNVEQLFRKDIFSVDDQVLNGACHGVIHRHFPWGYYMKFIAERFGALSRGRLMYGEGLKELAVKFRLTPIYDETIREALMERSDFEAVKRIFKDIRENKLELVFFQSTEKPTPLAYHLLYRHVDIPELIAPENVEGDNMARLKLAIEGRVIDLLCIDCGILARENMIANLSVRPACGNCGSNLLAPLFWSSGFVAGALSKKRAREEMSEDEQKALIRARRSADLVISYGKRAVVAQSVYGIGPQTASRVLAKMQESDDDFYRDLLEAKLQFIATKPYWNN